VTEHPAFRFGEQRASVARLLLHARRSGRAGAGVAVAETEFISWTLKTISPPELQKLLTTQSSAPLVDVRMPVEFAEVHVSPARSVPLDELKPNTVSLDSPGSALKRVLLRGSNIRQTHRHPVRSVRRSFAGAS
jgi:rhodanese-related sulfurtransferase